MIGLFLFVLIFSKISFLIQPHLTNTFTLVIWLIFFILLCFIVMSFLFTSLIGLSKEALIGKIKISNLFYYGEKFWIKNVPIMLLLAILSAATFQISTVLAFFIGKSTQLSINAATSLFFIFLFIGLAGVIIFFTFSSFYLVKYNLSIIESIKNSFKIVRKNYLKVFIISIIFFAIYFVLQFYSSNLPIVFSLIEYLIVTPYLSLILTKFINHEEYLRT